MPRRDLTAFEHRAIPIVPNGSDDALSPAEADSLTAIGELRPGFCERGVQSVRLASFCGVVNLGNRVLEVLPKVEERDSAESGRGLLLSLLRESDSYPMFQHLSARHDLQSATLIEVFIGAFLDSVGTIVRGGLLRRYQTLHDDLQVVRGRISAARQFATLATRADVVACEFDELTADNVWNRLVKTAVMRVRPWIRSMELHRRWIELIAVFDGVQDSGGELDDLRRLIYDRRAERYRETMMWVELIFLLLSPALRAGRHSAPALLFEMNRLFESAIASFLRLRASGSSLRIDAQRAQFHLATIGEAEGPKEFRLRPDLTIWRGTELIAIGDTKWKRLAVGAAGHLKPSEEDVYQMLAYAAAYRCSNLTLIYPWHSGLAQTEETTFRLPKMDAARPRIAIACVDLRERPYTLRRGKDASPIAELFG